MYFYFQEITVSQLWDIFGHQAWSSIQVWWSRLEQCVRSNGSGHMREICTDGARLIIFMTTSSNENIFRVTGPLWGESTGHRWIPFTKSSDAELWCFFDLRLNKRLSKQSRRRPFETPSCSLWRHGNVLNFFSLAGIVLTWICQCGMIQILWRLWGWLCRGFIVY